LQQKDVLFISHATPNDNAFAAWLAAKLELYGYSVWVDLKELYPGADFWNSIESTIREKSIKFLFVATKDSIASDRDGVKKELSVADKVKKIVPNFIVPLRADDVSYDDMPVEIIRLDIINFYDDWAGGLIKLLDYLEKQNVPKRTQEIKDMQEAMLRWKTVSSSELSTVIKQEDIYYSNLFPSIFPNKLYVYANLEIEGILKSKHLPYKKINELIITLACPICISLWLSKEPLYEEYDFSMVINGQGSISAFSKEIIKPNRLCVDLINWNIDEHFFQSGLLRFKPNDLSQNKNRYYFPAGSKSKRDVASRSSQLAGSFYGKRWHYALSAYYTPFPFAGIIMRSHFVFSEIDGKMLPDALQHTARRRKGKSLFNKAWKNLLQSAMYYLAYGEDYITVSLCCKNNTFSINRVPYKFVATESYHEPKTDVTVTLEELS
jgi:hypothetical protein